MAVAVARPIIGIDLGTTRCCIAYVDETGKAQVIPNDLGLIITTRKSHDHTSSGRNTTPSWVLYDVAGIKVGDTAINAEQTGSNLIYGKQFPYGDITEWKFKIRKGSLVVNSMMMML